MSTGVILAWATEAQQRGIISEKETLGLRLRWGDYTAYTAVLRPIIEQTNDFFKALARGVERAASIYGGADFALAFGGHEMAGYHPGPGAYLTYLTGARHSHLDSAGYSVDQKILVEKEMSPEGLADALLSEERFS
ncbi:MAG: aldehyde ferredoxin oxidoreductase C-terminal domain-containing protein [bacterium]